MIDPLSDLFASISSYAALSVAWEKVQSNNGCAGGDGQSTGQFSQKAPDALRLLAGRLKNGTYRPRPLRLHDLRKPGGGLRRLAIPSVSDRVVQTAVAQTLGPLLEQMFNSASFGYRPGKSVNMAVDRISALRARGYEWVVEADIVRAFDTVPHAPLLERLEQVICTQTNNQKLVDLIALWLEHGASELGAQDRGLAQGSPLSPLLFNLFLDQLDDRFDKGPVRIVRFADDFLLLATTREAAQDAQNRVTEFLGPLGLALDQEGTRVVSFDKGFKFLGHLFVRALVLPAKKDSESTEDPQAQAIMEDLAKEDANRKDDTSAGLDPAARVLYLQSPGRRLDLVNDSFVVISEVETEMLRLSHGRVDRIEVGPGVDVAPEVLRHALKTDTALDFADGHGQTLGSLSPLGHDRASLHLKQAKTVLDPNLRLALARNIVDARIQNQMTRLRVLNRTRKDPEVILKITQIRRMRIKMAHHADSVQSLMGHEGAAAQLYWPALARLCKSHHGAFTRQRPAADPLNAAINFLTALLTRDMRAAVLRAGLHPGFGVLHAVADRGEACVWDLMEGFRAVLTEGLAVSLFNRGRLKPAMFEVTQTSVRILPDGSRSLIRGYETAMARGAKSAHTGNHHTQHRRLLEEARAYARHLQNRTGHGFHPETQEF